MLPSRLRLSLSRRLRSLHANLSSNNGTMESTLSSFLFRFLLLFSWKRKKNCWIYDLYLLHILLEPNSIWWINSTVCSTQTQFQINWGFQIDRIHFFWRLFVPTCNKAYWIILWNTKKSYLSTCCTYKDKTLRLCLNLRK